jgi:hypothetical protein
MRKECLTVFLSCFFTLLALTGNALSETLTVCPTGCDYSSIQSAIVAATVGNDNVEVYPGTYTENIDFNSKRITVYSAYGPEDTIIEASVNNKSVVTINSTLGSDSDVAVLDGFTIKKGSGTTINGTIYGGGIYIFDSSPTITQCIITSNTVGNVSTGGSGAGIYINSSIYSSSPTITQCKIYENMAVTNGTDGGDGGGIHSDNYSKPTVTNCEVTENTAQNQKVVDLVFGVSHQMKKRLSIIV